ncbi:membrane protein [gut metagenome]|uniref:Membrane protein n=1 Tax=gut metagenome TaxID=749906 RepID=J9H4C7_9ZZZZ
MTLNHIHNHGNAILMRLINQLLQIFWRTETTGSSKETADMVTKTAIIRMFLQCHNLQAVVTLFNDTRQDIFSKFIIGTYLFGILSHTDMAFINQQWIALWLESLLLEYIFLLGIPYLCAEDLGLFILHDTTAPCRNAFTASTFPIHLHLIEVEVLHGLSWQLDFPIARIAYRLEAVLFIFLPAIEITDEIDCRSIWRPFAEDPLTRSTMQTEVHVSVCKFRQGLFSTSQFLHLVKHMVMTSLNGIIIGFEPWIVLNDFKTLNFH